MRFLSWVCLGIWIAGLVGWAPAAIAQLPLSEGQSSSQPPYGVQRLGLLEITPVRLDGQELFKIASPTVLNRTEPGSQVPVEVRARQIELNLSQLFAIALDSPAEQSYTTALDPDTLRVYVEKINSQPVLLAADGYLAQPRVLMTVTNTDAQYYSTSQDDLATRWQQILQTELQEALVTRQPAALRQQMIQAAQTLLLMVLLTGLLLGFWTLLGKRQTELEKLRTVQTAAALDKRQKVLEQEAVQPAFPTGRPLLEEADEPAWAQWLDALQHRISLQRRIKVVRFLRWLLFWAIVFTWLAGVALILGRFPQTRQLAIGLISTPVLILVTWFGIGLVNRLTDIAIDQVTKAWETDSLPTAETLQRRALRVTTIANVLKGLKTVLLYVVGLTLVLQVLDIAPVSVLALGAVLALAASFATQNLVKDLVNGFLILLEDQFAIGDYIDINGASGLVENLNLRITQLRNSSGNLITIPNSQINQVENMSRGWSRNDFSVEVAYETDVDRALEILRSVAEELALDPEWGSLILNPAEILGVEKISHSGITLRIWIRTQPLKQWAVGRELRRRLKLAFDRHQVKIGIPQQVLSGELTEHELPLEESQPDRATGT